MERITQLGVAIMRVSLRIALVAVLFLMVNINSYADECSDSAEHIAKLSSQNFKERCHALEYYKNNSLCIDEDASIALKQLFRAEMAKEKRFKVFAMSGKSADEIPKDIVYQNSEEYMMYSTNLCKIVSSMRDVSLLQLLLEHCMIEGIFLNYGDIAINVIVNAIEPNTNVGYRRNVIRVMKELLDEKNGKYVARGESRREIINELIKYAKKDNDYNVRSLVVRVLGEVGNELEVQSILDDIAKTDMHIIQRKDGTEFYPVRHEAQKVLDRIKGAKPEPPAIANQPAQ